MRVGLVGGPPGLPIKVNKTTHDTTHALEGILRSTKYTQHKQVGR